MNAPERTASFLLDEDIGEVKIVYTPDTKASTVPGSIFSSTSNNSIVLVRLNLSQFLFFFLNLPIIYITTAGYKCRYLSFEQGGSYHWKYFPDATVEGSTSSIRGLSTPSSTHVLHQFENTNK